MIIQEDMTPLLISSGEVAGQQHVAALALSRAIIVKALLRHREIMT